MDLSNLKPAAGATKKGKRIGRGQGSGRGGTATKGHKGQKSRAGASIPIWFEGGQMPLIRRIPKFGFTNRNRVEYKAVNLMNISALLESGKLKAGDISHSDLIDAGLARKKDLIKILGRGDIDRAINIEAHKCSASAKKKIEDAGGSVKLIGKVAEEAAGETVKEEKKAKKAVAAKEEVVEEVAEEPVAEEKLAEEEAKEEAGDDASDAEQA